jgi:predicted AAA+ superfamily ATPase
LKFHQTKMALSSLSIYRNLLKDTVIKKFIRLINCLCANEDATAFLNLYNDFFFTLVSSDTSFANHIIDQIIYDENPFSHRRSTGEEWSQITDAAKRDLESLQHVAEISPAEIKAQAQTLYGLQENFLSGLPEWECHDTADASDLPEREDTTVTSNPPEWESHRDSIGNSLGQQTEIKKRLSQCSSWSDCLPALAHFYRKEGAGIFAQYYAFIWERSDNSGFLKGIAYPDPVKLSDLFNYENERAEILENTLQFLKGYPANNVLLYGNRGTGKSSTVKALVNEYHSHGLRIIEVPKAYLSDFPEIIRELRGRTQKFIIFVDDLTFEDSTENYTALKAVLEGGLESRPPNVLIYATSNRRHLIKERFSDRFEPLEDDEIHKNDGVQEKLSLADRFGITVIFAAPDQERYLEIVSSIAEQRSIQMTNKDLQREALRWAARHNGLSPRTARQFIDWLEGHLAE